MRKTILASVKGWTPVIDIIVRDVGLISAVVFGKMWRHCQMEDGVCKASLETIGDGIGMDKSTVMRHAKSLCEAGYLKDLTPDRRNSPHVYADTGKASLNVGITVAERNATVAERNATVAENQLKKVLKKDSEDTNKSSGVNFGDVATFYEQNIAPLTSFDSQLLGDLCDEHTPHWVLEALKICVKNNKRNLAYAEGILKRWKESNCYGENGSKEQVKTQEVEIIRAPKNKPPAVSIEKMRKIREKVKV